VTAPETAGKTAAAAKMTAPETAAKMTSASAAKVPTAATAPKSAESRPARYFWELRRYPMLEPQEEYTLAKSWCE